MSSKLTGRSYNHYIFLLRVEHVLISGCGPDASAVILKVYTGFHPTVFIYTLLSDHMKVDCDQNLFIARTGPEQRSCETPFRVNIDAVRFLGSTVLR